MNKKKATKKAPKPTVPKAEHDKLKEDYKKLIAANEERDRKEAGSGNKEHQIIWRETDGIYTMIKRNADRERLSVNAYCKMVIHKKCGFH